MSTPDKNPAAYRNLKRIALVTRDGRIISKQRYYHSVVTHVIDIDEDVYRSGAYEALVEMEVLSGVFGAKGVDFHHIVMLHEGTEVFDTLFRNVDMSRRNLRNTEFRKCGFENCFMQGSAAKDVRFYKCDFHSVNAIGCDFEDSIFSGCESVTFRMDDSRLKGSDFVGCEFAKTSFAGCNLYNAKFEASTIFSSSFDDATGYPRETSGNDRIQVDRETSSSIMKMRFPVDHRIF